MRFLKSLGALLLAAQLLSGATVFYHFSGTWGGTLGPFQAGSMFSGAAVWYSPATMGDNNLAGFFLTMPPAAGFSPGFLQNPPITLAVANYLAGGVFQYVRVDFRSSADNQDYHLFLSPSMGAAIFNAGFSQNIVSSSYTADGPHELPEPGTGEMVALVGLILAVWLRRREVGGVR